MPPLLPALDAEPIFEALFERLRGITAFKSWGRKLKDFTKVTRENQPALFLEADDRIPEQNVGEPTIWHIGALVVIYYRQDKDALAAPSTTVNELSKLVEEALRHQPDEPENPDNPLHTTLGGLVDWCWLAPQRIRIQPTAADNQGIVVIPIEMVVALEATAA